MPRSAKPKPQIDGIRVKVQWDESPDSSWIGRYTDNPTGKEESEGRIIDRQARGDRERGTYRFFVAAMGPKETGNPESVEADYQRMEALNAGQWGFVGIWVEAAVAIPTGLGGATIQTIRSGGLWGIENDAGQDYLASIVRDELSDLKGQLQALGVKLPHVLEAEPDRDGFLHGPVREKAKARKEA